MAEKITLITLSFQLPINDANTVRVFAADIKKWYNGSVAYYKDSGIIEVSVDTIKMNNVIHAAIARNFILLQD